jgi:hypothetical protein
MMSFLLVSQFEPGAYIFLFTWHMDVPLYRFYSERWIYRETFMKITSGMLPYEIVVEVRDRVNAQVTLDRQGLDLLDKSTQYLTSVGWLSAILEYGAGDRKLINRAFAEGTMLKGECYKNCHQCCNMSSEYDVEAFDILLSYSLNLEAVKAVCLAGWMDGGKKWCGMLENGLCTIHDYKPYTCLLTLPSPQGAETGGCYFKGDRNAKTVVHQPAMIATGRMRMLFKKYLPELPEFAGRNMNQAFTWAVHQDLVARTSSRTQ